MFQFSVWIIFWTPFLYIVKKKRRKKGIAFPYGTKHFHLLELMKWFLCGAHLNFDNSTHKVYHINKFVFNFFFELGASPKDISML